MHDDDSMVANALTVTAIQLFHRAPEELCHQVANALRLRHFGRGEEVVAQHETAKKVCFVLSGVVRVSHTTGKGREVILLDRQAGELVGPFEWNDVSHVHFRIAALDPSCVGFMSCNDLRRILGRHPEFLNRLLSQGVQLIRVLSERLIELATLKVKHRIYAELLRLAPGDPRIAPTLVVSPAPRHADLANRVSTHREAVTRELGLLEKTGAIKRVNGSLIIVDPVYLHEAIRRAQ